MIADPLAILEENEVHIAFSSAFKDHKTGVDQVMLHDIDVLVARSPAHLPSDIQKVRAVFKPELRLYRDVIVFPSKGPVSLASKLSGGDYDGDKAWICWDSDIVTPFENAEVPIHPTIASYGIEKDTTKVSDLLGHNDCTNRFLRHAFKFNLQINMLGTCTNYHEAYCYHKGTIDSPQAISIGVLLGNLVDSAKSGFMFDDAKWAAFQKRKSLPRNLSKPAYKDKNKAKPTTHLIDHLVFVIARNTREDVLRKFNEHFHDVSPRDDDLSRIRNDTVEEAKSHAELAKVLENLETGLKTINNYWKRYVRVDQDDEDNRPTSSKPNGPSFITVVEQCRGDFLTLSPTLDTPATSDKIATWQHDHAVGRSSHWDVLKASVVFHRYYMSTFIWHVAGVELGEIKAMARGRGTYRVVDGAVFEALKLDPRVVDGAVRREMLERHGVEEDDSGDFGGDEEFADFE